MWSAPPPTSDEVWNDAVNAIYGEPFGFDTSKMMAWNTSQAEAIAAANPNLKHLGYEFVVARADVPFPVLQAALMGPSNYSPYDGATRAYSVLEMTPLAAGQAMAQNVAYVGDGGAKTVAVGGFVEAHAFGAAPTNASAAAAPGAPGRATARMAPAANAKPFTLASAVGVSSEAYGSEFAALGLDALEDFDYEADLWTPRAADAAPKATSMLLSDGGCIENLGVVPLLQRGVRSIVSWDAANAPLADAAAYDPYADEPSDAVVDGYLASLFGYDVYGADADGEFVANNQVFDVAGYAPLVAGLQAAQAAGDGACAGVDATTQENALLGVAGGRAVRFTVCVLDAPENWLAALPDDVRASIDAGAKGAFENFPYYDTFTQTELTPAQANLMANAMTWIVLKNEALFAAAVEAGEAGR